MVFYVKLEPEEEASIKKALIRTVSVSERFQDTGNKVAKLKRSKKYSMRGTVTAIKDINKEIKKIKEMLPQLEQPKEQKQKKEIKTIKIVRKKKGKKVNKKAKTKFKKVKESKYQEELERLREQIYKL